MKFYLSAVLFVFSFGAACGNVGTGVEVSASKVGGSSPTATPVSKTGAAVITETPGRTNGIVKGEIPETNEDNGENIPPVPKVWLEYIVDSKDPDGPARTVSVELPAEAKSLLSDFWDFWIKRSDLKTNLLRLNHTTYDLHQIKIETPSGERPISLEEAHDLVDFMTDAAKAIRTQSK